MKLNFTENTTRALTKLVTLTEATLKVKYDKLEYLPINTEAELHMVEDILRSDPIEKKKIVSSYRIEICYILKLFQLCFLQIQKIIDEKGKSEDMNIVFKKVFTDWFIKEYNYKGTNQKKNLSNFAIINDVFLGKKFF